jgi:hypothetical protein
LPGSQSTVRSLSASTLSPATSSRWTTTAFADFVAGVHDVDWNVIRCRVGREQPCRSDERRLHIRVNGIPDQHEQDGEDQQRAYPCGDLLEHADRARRSLGL